MNEAEIAAYDQLKKKNDAAEEGLLQMGFKPDVVAESNLHILAFLEVLLEKENLVGEGNRRYEEIRAGELKNLTAMAREVVQKRQAQIEEQQKQQTRARIAIPGRASH